MAWYHEELKSRGLEGSPIGVEKTLHGQAIRVVVGPYALLVLGFVVGLVLGRLL